MKTEITLSTFQGQSASDGTFKTWGDIQDGGYLGNLINNEVLGSLFKAPKEIIGENIWYEYKTLPKGSTWNSTKTSKKPVLNRVMFNLPEKRKQFDYNLDLFGEKEAKAWSFYIGENDANIWKQILNYNNTVAINAILQYSTATGQFKTLTNLSLPNKTALEYFNDTALIADGANSIMSGQTIVNLGLNMDRLSIVVSPQIMRRITTGIAGVNVSQGAYDAVKKGQINNLFGYDFKTSIYLGHAMEIMDDEVIDFTNLIGVVYNLDSLGFHQQSVKIINLPKDLETLQRAFGWKPFAAMLPSMEHTSFILVKKVPTIVEVNAARAALLLSNSGAYGNLPGGKLNVITADEYAVMVTNSTIFDFLPLPNVELPAGTLLDAKKKK